MASHSLEKHVETAIYLILMIGAILSAYKSGRWNRAIVSVGAKSNVMFLWFAAWPLLSGTPELAIAFFLLIVVAQICLEFDTPALQSIRLMEAGVSRPRDRNIALANGVLTVFNGVIFWVGSPRFHAGTLLTSMAIAISLGWLVSFVLKRIENMNGRERT